jgi:hypothetical protein
MLAFAGAIIVAGIAALTAHVRQERSLQAESARESARFEHERHLLDLAELRLLLDETAQVVWKLLNDLGEWNGSVGRTEYSRTKWTKDAVAKVSAYRLAMWDRVEGDFRPLINRLAIRLGRGHPLVEQLFVLNDIFFKANRHFEMRGEAGENVRADADKVQMAALEGWAEMVSLFSSLVGSKVDFIVS